MKIVRQGVFETNSSSAHSLTFKKGDELVLPKYPHEYVLIDINEFRKFNGEPNPPKEYSSLQDRVHYVLASIWTYFNDSYPVWIEIPKEYYDYAIETEESYLKNCNPEDFYAPTDSIKFLLREHEGKFYHLVDRHQLSYFGLRLTFSLEKFLVDYAGIIGFEFKNRPVELEMTDKTVHGKLLKGDLKTVRYASDWFFYTLNYPNELDQPIPLDKLLDGEWLKDFLFSESTKIRIGTTDSPIDPTLIGYGKDQPIYTSNEGEMRKITKKYELVLNSVSYQVNKNSKSGYSYNDPLNVFRGVK